MNIQNNVDLISLKNEVETIYPSEVIEARKNKYIKVRLDKGHELKLEYIENDNYGIDFLGTHFLTKFVFNKNFRIEKRNILESGGFAKKSNSGFPKNVVPIMK